MESIIFIMFGWEHVAYEKNDSKIETFKVTLSVERQAHIFLGLWFGLVPFPIYVWLITCLEYKESISKKIFGQRKICCDVSFSVPIDITLPFHEQEKLNGT